MIKARNSKPASSPKNPDGIKVGPPEAPPLYGLKKRSKYLPFSHAEERLEKSRNYWICTTRADGRPHSIPVWGFWIDGQVIFGTARTSRKAQNLTKNSAVSVHLESGDDVVIVEGNAAELDASDKAIFKKLDAASRAKYDMPLMVVPEGVFYSVRPRVVLAWTEKDFLNTATRWKFSSKT